MDCGVHRDEGITFRCISWEYACRAVKRQRAARAYWGRTVRAVVAAALAACLLLLAGSAPLLARSVPAATVVVEGSPKGGGYWLVASDGTVYAFGTARNYGDMRGKHLNQPVVGIIASPSGKGYWLVAKDGGVFSFGAITFHGSLPGERVTTKSVVGMASSGPPGVPATINFPQGPDWAEIITAIATAVSALILLVGALVANSKATRVTASIKANVFAGATGFALHVRPCIRSSGLKRIRLKHESGLAPSVKVRAVEGPDVRAVEAPDDPGKSLLRAAFANDDVVDPGEEIKDSLIFPVVWPDNVMGWRVTFTFPLRRRWFLVRMCWAALRGWRLWKKLPGWLRSVLRKLPEGSPYWYWTALTFVAPPGAPPGPAGRS